MEKGGRDCALIAARFFPFQKMVYNILLPLSHKSDTKSAFPGKIRKIKKAVVFTFCRLGKGKWCQCGWLDLDLEKGAAGKITPDLIACSKIDSETPFPNYFSGKRKNLAPPQIPTNSSCTGTGISPLFWSNAPWRIFSSFSLSLFVAQVKQTPDQISRDFSPLFSEDFFLSEWKMCRYRFIKRKRKCLSLLFAVLTRWHRKGGGKRDFSNSFSRWNKMMLLRGAKEVEGGFGFLWIKGWFH